MYVPWEKEHLSFVSLKVAQMLRDIGFYWHTKFVYVSYSGGPWELSPAWRADNWNDEDNRHSEGAYDTFSDYISAPTLDIAQGFLFEEFKLWVEIKILSITGGKLLWYYKIYKIDECNNICHKVNFLFQSEISYDTYKKALELGILKCLIYLKENNEHT